MDNSALSSASQSSGNVLAASNTLDITGDTVAVLVRNKVFHVHENLLAGSSKFFQNALKPEWRTDPSKPIDLTDSKLHWFKKYSQWLYTKQILLDDNEKPQNMGRSHMLLADLYVFGGKIIDQEFQRTVLATLVSLTKTLCLDAIRIIYAGTTASDPARRLMADMCAFTTKPTSRRITELDPNVDGELMVDLCAAFVKYRKQPEQEQEQPWISDLGPYLPGGQKEAMSSEPQLNDDDSMITDEV